MYVKLENDTPIEWPLAVQRIRFENKNVSFPADMSNVNVREYGFAPFQLADPEEYNSQFEEARELPPVENNGVFVQQWEIVQKYTPEEKEALIAELAVKAAAAAESAGREKRDALLAETDWMALSDNTLSSEWADYRQALRDITTHANWPNLEDADWPTKP
jgi:hypothetical protein